MKLTCKTIDRQEIKKGRIYWVVYQNYFCGSTRTYSLYKAKCKHVPQPHDLAVHGDAFDILVGLVQDCPAGGFIDAAGFDAHEAVLHHIEPPDTVLPSQFVEIFEQF